MYPIPPLDSDPSIRLRLGPIIESFGGVTEGGRSGIVSMSVSLESIQDNKELDAFEWKKLKNEGVVELYQSRVHPARDL